MGTIASLYKCEDVAKSEKFKYNFSEYVNRIFDGLAILN